MKKSIGVIGKIISRKDMKRISSIMLVFLISFFVVLSNYKIVKANVADLIVEGGSIGTGGLGDLGGELGTASIFVALGLMAAGFEVQLTNETLESGKTPSQYYTEQLADWLDNNVMTYDEYVNEFLADINIAKNGIIYYGQNALDKLKQFGNWVVSNVNDNFVNRADLEAGSPETVTVGNFDFLYTSEFLIEAHRTGMRDLVLVRANKPFLLGVWGAGPLIISDDSTSVQGTVYRSDGTIYFDQVIEMSQQVATSDLYFGYWGLTGWFNFDYVAAGVPQIGIYEDRNYNEAINRVFANVNADDLVLGGSGADAQDCFIGSPSEWADYIPGLSLPEGYMGAIDPGILTDLEGEIEGVGDYSIPLDEYIKALENEIDEVEADIPVVDADDGQLVLVPDPDLVLDPQYEQVDDEDVPEETTPVIDPSIPAEPNEIINVSKVTGLTDVFPFCIPFDLYRLFNKFKAEPIAPRIQVHWQIPRLNIYLDLDLDFSVFNNVATVLRTMELVAAVVGLALVTRRIFLRS